MSVHEALGVLYTLTGPLLTLAYVPQLMVLSNDGTGARAISLLTWAGWSLAL